MSGGTRDDILVVQLETLCGCRRYHRVDRYDYELRIQIGGNGFRHFKIEEGGTIPLYKELPTPEHDGTDIRQTD